MTTEDQNALQGVTTNESDANPAQEIATENQVTEQTEDQQQTEVKTEETPKVEESAKKDPPKRPWEHKRINQLTWEKNEERRKREAAEALLAQYTNNNQEVVEGKQLSPVEIDRLAEQKADQKLAKQTFDQKCNSTVDAGKEAYKDFEDAVQILGQVGLNSPQFFDIVTDLPKSHEILYHLGKNPDEAERLLNLSPTKQAIELARLETKLSKPPVQKQIPKTPAPIKPLGGAASSRTYSDSDISTMSDEEYTEYRKKWADKS